MSRWEIILSGSGGQGLLLAGIILAEAATNSGFHVVQAQSYGPEARGGASRAEVIINDEPIDYPRTEQADLLVALTAEARSRYLPHLKSTGVAIVDESLTGPGEEKRIFTFPIFNTARKSGKLITANIVALGIIAGVWAWLDQGNLEEAITARLPAAFIDLNLSAFRAGLLLGHKERLNVQHALTEGKGDG
jgi:2-oxoglutarate ferredoxin oxidoreductase subunit gamma